MEKNGIDRGPSDREERAGDDRLAAGLRGFGPVGIASILTIILSGTIAPGHVAVPLGALLALAWARRSRTPWSALGYVRPWSWGGGAALGILLGIALKLLMKAIVLPLLGAPPVNAAYHSLVGNRAMLPAAIWMMLMAGFGEETVFRGFLFERLGRLFGRGAGARLAIVLLTSAVFGLAHYSDQGFFGALQGTMTGLVLGTLFSATGSLWIPMVAHAAFDLAALAIIHLDLETAVAHLVFRQ
jgi:hypothetical protein